MTAPRPELPDRGSSEIAGEFPHHWQATILPQRPLILPRRRFVYPREAEEIERGALEIEVRAIAGFAGEGEIPKAWEPFLATCALGFADPLAPTGIWSCPHPDQLCAVAGGYAYLIDTSDPQRFEQVAYRPVLAVHTVLAERLLLFVGSHSLVAYGERGLSWESPRLSDEGVTILSLENGEAHGAGWELRTDRERPFVLDLRTGSCAK